MTRHALEVVSVNGQFGQVINPGDKVIFMTTCAHSHSFGHGTYEGLVNGGARISESYEKITFHHPETGEDITDYQKSDAFAIGIVGQARPKYPRYVGWRATPLETAAYESERVVFDAWNAKYQVAYKTRVEKRTPAIRNRSLQNNIMFLQGAV